MDNERNVSKQKNNWVIIAVSLAVGIFSWFGIREQINVGDEQFVKGMIPHHAAAIQMSEKAKLTDPELIQLKKTYSKHRHKKLNL